jgi:teichuronic acid biosynthesis glycosyltransferase TuaG
VYSTATSEPLVSIVMPAYNTSAYIAFAIDSALAQTVADFELLIVDDGSSDETKAIADRYAAKDSRLTVWSRPNGGACRARNDALGRARGRFVAFLDSDDVWMPEYLQTHLDILERHPEISVVTANAINLDGPLDGQPYWTPGPEIRPLTMLEMIEREDSVCIMSVFRRAVHTTIGGFDEAFVYGSEDYDYWLRAADAGFRFLQVRRPIAFYRRRPGGASAATAKMLTGITATLRKALERCGEDASRSREKSAILRQLHRFECERLRVEAAAALRDGDFGVAAERFDRLSRTQGGARLACIAAWSRYAPSSLRWVDSARRNVGMPFRMNR